LKKEIKICLPFYKIIYSILFIFILSLVRGISTVFEIGITVEPAIAFLTIVFCADTYLMEWNEKRREVFLLYPKKTKHKVITVRLLLQMIYMFGLSIVGYAFFYIQRPRYLEEISSFYLLTIFLVSILGTVLFWGTLSITLSNIMQNIWAGMGTSILIWLITNSTSGEQLLGKWNVFSFVFRDRTDNLEWLCGKVLSVFLAAAMFFAIPSILKKRG